MTIENGIYLDYGTRPNETNQMSLADRIHDWLKPEWRLKQRFRFLQNHTILMYMLKGVVYWASLCYMVQWAMELIFSSTRFKSL